VRAICGLLPATAGKITHDGKAIHTLPPHLRTRHGIAVVLENRHLFGELTVRNNLDLAAAHGERHTTEQRRISAADRKFSVEQVLDLFPFMRGRLDDAVELLSGGEQQMVAIARALLLNRSCSSSMSPLPACHPKLCATSSE
jgi:branched-chain amino acid transport system ATP-binding protein/nonpolar-amino-acid-transporting ATPase